MAEYTAYHRNGAITKFEFDDLKPEHLSEHGLIIDDDILDQMFDVAGKEMPGGLCHQCADKFDFGEDTEVYLITDADGEEIYHELSYEEKRIASLEKQVAELTAKLAGKV